MYQTPLPVYHSSSEFPPENFQRKRTKNYEQKTILKGDGDVSHGNGTKDFYISSTAGATTLSQFSPDSSLLMPNI